MIPFGSLGADGPTALRLEPGETGLPGPSYLKGHFITTILKAQLLKRDGRVLSQSKMRVVVEIIRRAFDPDARWEPQSAVGRK